MFAGSSDGSKLRFSIPPRSARLFHRWYADRVVHKANHPFVLHLLHQSSQQPLRGLEWAACQSWTQKRVWSLRSTRSFPRRSRVPSKRVTWTMYRSLIPASCANSQLSWKRLPNDPCRNSLAHHKSCLLRSRPIADSQISSRPRSNQTVQSSCRRLTQTTVDTPRNQVLCLARLGSTRQSGRGETQSGLRRLRLRRCYLPRQHMRVSDRAEEASAFRRVWHRRETPTTGLTTSRREPQEDRQDPRFSHLYQRPVWEGVLQGSTLSLQAEELRRLRGAGAPLARLGRYHDPGAAFGGLHVLLINHFFPRIQEVECALSPIACLTRVR